MKNLQTVIGLEIHVQLKTRSKMFCGCDNKSDEAEPNINTCPVCMGMPGTLPSTNGQAVEWTIKTGVALNCKIPDESKFDRKHYFYPDLPKGFQISQYDKPFTKNGYLEIDGKKIGITRIHLEEDAGKLMHSGDGSLVDLNRAGTPLMEIVSEPEIDSPELAQKFLKELRLIVRYLGVSEADMEKGHLRCDANISVKNDAKSTHIVEIKNMNSFRSVLRALKYEEKRLKENFEEASQKKTKETRAWDEKSSSTFAMREKEEAKDYRYFPEPDIPQVNSSSRPRRAEADEQFPPEADQPLAEIVNRRDLPELPQQRRERYKKELRLEDHFVEAIVNKPKYAIYFDEVVKAGADPRKAADYMINERFGDKIEVQDFVELLRLLSSSKISGNIAKDVGKEMLQSGKNAEEIIREKGLAQISDKEELEKIISEVIKQNERVVNDYKAGKGQALGFLVGRVMQRSKGQANPQMVNQILKDKLK